MPEDNLAISFQNLVSLFLLSGHLQCIIMPSYNITTQHTSPLTHGILRNKFKIMGYVKQIPYSTYSLTSKTEYQMYFLNRLIILNK